MNTAEAFAESLPWDSDALEEIRQAPRHLHEMIRAICEEQARSEGKKRVDMAVVGALKPDHGSRRPAQSASGGNPSHSVTAQSNASRAAGAAGGSPAASAAAPVANLDDLDRMADTDPFMDFYAEEGEDPLSGAFLRRSSPHVSIPSERVVPADLQATWAAALRDILPQQRRRSLYVHIPFCRSRCSYCPFYLMAYHEQSAADYVELLLRDIELTASQIPAFDADSGGEYQAIFFGGGTPSDLSGDQLARLIKALAKNFPLSRDCEITVEGRVRGFEADKARACRDAGATRISLGVQTFDTAVRRAVGRFADEAEVCRTLEALGAVEGLALNIDLMYGLPGQTWERWEHDIARVHGIGGIRGVDLYELKRIPGSPLTRAQSMGRVAEGAELAERSQMYAYGAAALEAGGWERLSCCHWGRDGNRQNRYNVFAKSGAVCLPFGCSSGGRIGRLSLGGPQDAEGYRKMLDNGEKPLSGARWLDPVSQTHDRIAGQLEFGRLDPESVSTELGARLEPLLSQWQRSGLLERSANGWGLTLPGRFWIKELSSRLAKAIA